MQTKCRVLLSLVLIGLCSLAAVRAGAQVESVGGSNGAFKRASQDVPDHTRSMAGVEGGTITLELHQATIKDALHAVSRQAQVRLLYNDSDLPSDRLVTATLRGATIEQALAIVLRGTELRAYRTESGMAIERQRQRERSDSSTRQGSLGGRITDARSGDPIPAVVVRLREATLSTSTGSNGTYRFPSVPAGTYTLTARQIGYERIAETVLVGDDEETRADLTMTPVPAILSQVVTTGTMIPTSVKALPTPVTVVTSDQIAQRHASTLMAIIRQAVPTAVAHDAPDLPANTDISVRGASSLSGAGEMKIFIDGVEASSFASSPVDPESIDRIEVIRGPQAATLYGADAASGVIQIFTKRGDSSSTRPQLSARVEMGAMQTPYAAFGHVLRQQYSMAVSGGAPSVSYRLGSSYKRLADYAPENGAIGQSGASVYGGMNYSRGIIVADISGRYYRNTVPQARNPELFSTGYVPYSVPPSTRGDFASETYGARTLVSPAHWWRNQLTLGIDRFGIANVQTQPRHTTASDTLLRLSESNFRKLSVGYNSTATGSFGNSSSGSLTLGVDHYSQHVTTMSASRALATSGTITTVPAGGVSFSDNTIKNTGYFAQAQLALHDLLFLTAGVRAEDNASFGRDYGLAILPRVGLSLVRSVGETTLKLRASYGESLRTPGPTQSIGKVSPSAIQLANPDLGPERQKGWDGGLDLVLGNHGSLSISGFDQTALDLIAFLTVASTPTVTHQYQNIGRVSNRGLEVEATYTPSARMVLKAQYGHVHSVIREVGAAGGDVEAGDAPVGVPSHTAGAALTVTARAGTTVNAGLTYVGSFNAMDWVAALRCFASGSADECPPSFLDNSSYRDFIVRYPGFVKINASVEHHFNRTLKAFVAIDNLTNKVAFEYDNAGPLSGRTTMLGIEVTY